MDTATRVARAPRTVVAAAVVALLVLLSFRHAYDGFTGANEAIRYFFTVALVEQHRVDVTDVVHGYHSRVIDRAERDGRIYLDKAPGMSVLAIPGYLLDTRVLHPHAIRPPVPPFAHAIAWMTFVASIVPSFVAALALASRLRERTGDGRIAAAFVLALLAATPFGLYASLFFGHAACGSFAALGFLALERIPRGGSQANRAAAVAGFLGSLTVACEYTTAPVVALLGVFALSRGGWRAGVAFGLAAVPVTCLLAAYHTAAFGGPLTPGYAFVAGATFREGHSHGLMGVTWPRPDAVRGVTFGRMRGLFFCAPWLLAGVPGTVALVRRDRAAGLFVGAACVVALWVNAGFYYWNGGDAAAARHLVAVTPLFAYAAMYAPEVFVRPVARTVAFTVVGALLIVSATQLWWTFATFPFHPESASDPFYAVSLPLFVRGELAPGPFATVLPAWVRATVPLALVLGTWGWLAGARVWRRTVLAVVLALAWLALGTLTSDVGAPGNRRALEIAEELVRGG